jgi:hypothetical protein
MIGIRNLLATYNSGRERHYALSRSIATSLPGKQIAKEGDCGLKPIV